MSVPYHSSYVRPGRAGSCLTWAGGCGAPTPAPPKIRAPAESAIRARCVSALLSEVGRPELQSRHGRRPVLLNFDPVHNIQIICL